MADVRLIPVKLNNRQDPLRLGGFEDARNPVVTTLVTAQNVDIDDNSLVTRRSGRTRVYTGTPHSFWVYPQDKGVAYFVEGSQLKRLNANYSTTTVATLRSNRPLCYTEINNEIVASNGTDLGWLSGLAFTSFVGGGGDTFSTAMPAGQYIAFDYGDGAFLSARESVIYRSKPYNAETRDIRYSEFPMDGYIRMLACVEDGWWVATDKHVSFVQRDGGDGFTFVHISDNVPPDGAFEAGWEDGEDTQRRYVTWVSADGFCVGHAGGKYENISPDTALPTGSSGKLISRTHNGISQYIAVIHNPEGSDKFTAPSLNVNTISV